MRIALFAATSALILIAAAPPTRDQLLKVMHERHEGMETIGKATKAAARELQSASPNLAVVRSSASEINKLASQAAGWYPRGTGPELGKTGAKPAIWQDPKDFSAKLAAFQKAAGALNSSAATGDVSTTKARFADMGGTCKACHDKYRSEMKH